jgi:hypothetical protein
MPRSFLYITRTLNIEIDSLIFCEKSVLHQHIEVQKSVSSLFFFVILVSQSLWAVKSGFVKLTREQLRKSNGR